MVNAWMQTVQKVKNSMPKGTSLKDILIAAKKVYKKPKALAEGVANTAKKVVKKAAKKAKKTLKGKKRRKTKGNKKRRTVKKSKSRRRRRRR